MDLKDTCAQYTDVPIRHPPRVEPRRCPAVDRVIPWAAAFLEDWPSFVGVPRTLHEGVNEQMIPSQRGSFHLKNPRGKNFKTHQVSLETHVKHRSTGRGRYLAGSLATDQAVACFSWIPTKLPWGRHGLALTYSPLLRPASLCHPPSSKPFCFLSPSFRYGLSSKVISSRKSCWWRI